MTPLRFLIANAIACVLLAPQAVFAQEGTAAQLAPELMVPKIDVHHREQCEENSTVLVITLKHANCRSIGHLLNGVFPQFNTIADPGTNSVVLSGPSDKIDEVKKLVAEVDRPAQATTIGPKVEQVRILHRHANEVAAQLMLIYNSTDLRVGFDRSRGWILLRGEEEHINSARKILKTLDTPAGTASIEFAFMRASLSGEGEAAPLPKGLREVAAELSDVGSVSLLGRLSTVAVEGDDFSVEGTDTTQQSYQVEGKLISAAEDGSVRIKLRARMISRNACTKKEQASDEDTQGEDDTSQDDQKHNAINFDIETTVQTQRGDYVVLGSAPTGWSAGETAILVLYVRHSK